MVIKRRKKKRRKKKNNIFFNGKENLTRKKKNFFFLNTPYFRKAWKANENLSKEEAINQYIKVVKDLDPSFEIGKKVKKILIYFFNF